MKLKDTLRTLMRVRVERELPPPGAKPPIGSSIVRDRLRIRLKHPINSEQWEWFVLQGWRTIDMRTNRRHYTCVPEKILGKLLEAGAPERDVLHRELIKFIAARHQPRRENGARS